MLKYIHTVLLTCCALLLLPITNTRGQDLSTYSDVSIKNGISKPNTLATHPFGILFYTLPHNLKVAPDRKSSLNIQISSGNVWGQPITVYVPSLEEDRTQMEALPFYSRNAAFNQRNNPSETYSFQYDGVIKDLRLTYSHPIGTKNELSISARSFLLTKGTFPFTALTGDQFIEFFHSNIAGGEDPFGRRRRQMDDANISYTDREGRSMEIAAGSYVFSGIETAYYHYPKLFLKQHIALNIGGHVGLNLSAYNQSLDMGISLAGVKNFNPNKKGQFQVGLGLNLLHKAIIPFNDDQVDLGTSSLFGSFEGHLEYSLRNNRRGHHSFGLNYRIQTPYNTKKEEAYYVPFSPDLIARWHDAARHLYKFPSYWSLIYSFTRRVEFSVYLQQDMLVNNAPDIQTGVRMKIPFSL